MITESDEFAHGDFVLHEGRFAMVVDESDVDSFPEVRGDFAGTLGWPVAILREFEEIPVWVSGWGLERTSLEEWMC